MKMYFSNKKPTLNKGIATKKKTNKKNTKKIPKQHMKGEAHWHTHKIKNQKKFREIKYKTMRAKKK